MIESSTGELQLTMMGASNADNADIRNLLRWKEQM